MQKRLKSLDEGTAPQIINKTSLDKALRRNALKSKTYAHNKKVMSDIKNRNLKESKQSSKVLKMFNSILRFLFGVIFIIIAIILLIAIFTKQTI